MFHLRETKISNKFTVNWPKIFVCKKIKDDLCGFMRKINKKYHKYVVYKSKKLYWCAFFVVFCEFVKKRMF